MITLEDYLGRWTCHKDVTQEVIRNATILLSKVSDVCDLAFSDGVDFVINPATNSYISGQKWGGFRTQDCPIGASNSAHKTGEAVDIYDPNNELDDWCMRHVGVLKERNVYIEHPTATPKWCHMSIRSPKSGKTVFYP